jgi:hypothetical protein
MIQQVWIGETLPEIWIEQVLGPVYKKSDKLDCKIYRGICILNVAYKVFAKVLLARLSPYANAVVKHYQARFQSGKSTTYQLFYDTITMNEIYVIMAELDFLPYQTNTSNQSNAGNCQMLRQNTDRLFGVVKAINCATLGTW